MMSLTETKTERATQPVLFIPHGAGPCFFMDWKPAGIWDAMARSLEALPHTLPARPRAILIISAHWQTTGFRVSATEQPELNYDFYGFPAHTYRLRYPAPGSPQLAGEIGARLSQAGLDCQPDPGQCFDHGVFVPLKLMFPEADIPVVQLSLQSSLDPALHLAAGRALAPLRDEGVLIIGSGMSFHNMRGYGNAQFSAPSAAFDDWLTGAIGADSARREAALCQWTQAPAALQCHPPGDEEHLLPLMVAAGAAGTDSGHKVFSAQVMQVRLSAFRFG
ncbi:DODA-type extradiol aromatic ring-opening family dioxygenase [Photobacterium atrarenae]|uniref:Dioxygenase n=1 Tax=Photobacterium atrarenae TaxID=865757 RepID=A0ABY5GQI1_9GAMM|nr:class III extradiol ring-cleavage dioxygenase [Photobacterium atrarenae]UTV31001.1 dioxygenase [Photobacterium atrarenae]